jgi:hypothetical protein
MYNNNHHHQITYKNHKSRLEKGGFPSTGIHLGLCENPLPPLDEAVEAAD